MIVPDYEYALEDCDVPNVRRASLHEYRVFRCKCMQYLRGTSDTSVVNQMYDLAWHTVVFRTLNEARRIEPERSVNGAFWDLTSAGYASLMTLGIRKLVDRDSRTDSVWNVISQVERRPELLTRENFICYDGLPYDYEVVQREHIASLDMRGGGNVSWLQRRGPEAWATSKMMHEAFDRLSRNPTRRSRSNTIHPTILDNLKSGLSHAAIERVCTLADKRMAHAERISKNSDPVPTATYEDIDNALRQIVRIVNFLSSSFFYDTAFSFVVAVPQYNVLEGLDQSWITKDNVASLHQFWNNICESMDAWADDEGSEFLPI